MALQIPASVERRVRQKWSRRAKLTGYVVLTLYIALLFAAMFLVKSRIWLVFMWSSGFAVGIRYLRAGRLLEREGDNAIVDEATKRLLNEYEERIGLEGRREVAGGTLSMPTGTGDGKVSLTHDAGGLSPTPDE